MSVMTWLVWLMLAVIIAAVAGVSGLQPKGARPVASTRLMGMARLVLVALALFFAYIAFRSRGGF
jgi:hypothetical protein